MTKKNNQTIITGMAVATPIGNDCRTFFTNAVNGIIKVRINHLGQIVKVGEY